MGKFDGILICTDLDGTLLRGDRTVSCENLDAIEYFKSEGGYFTFITGRMPYFAKKIYDLIRPNAPFGCINGGGIYDPIANRYIWAQTAPREILELVEYIDDRVPGIGIQVNTLETLYFCRENDEMARFRRSTGMPNIVCDYRDIDEPIGKIVFGDIREENIIRVKELLDAHPKASYFDFIRSEKTLYEILPRGISKGSVLPRLTRHLGLDMAKTVAVGDYNNDISMLRAARVGVAVANAVDEVKVVADRVTVSNEEHAIARIISEIENGEIEI